MSITRKQLSLSVIGGLIIFIGLSIANVNTFQVLNIFGLIFLLAIPGMLTIFAIDFNGLLFWDYVGVAVGFSVLELISMVLIGNTLLPFAGIVRPLDKNVLLWEIGILVISLLMLAWKKIKIITIPIKRYGLFDNQKDFILALFPVIFVVLSIFGAIHLNDGGSGIITTIMLIGIGLYSTVVIFHKNEFELDTIPTALFFISLSLLLMTSLRGWFVTGHDIQKEYQVFELTKNSGIWLIANFRDAYNACMSITILPTIFSNLLRLPDPYVYKVLFQVIFAMVPGIIYITTRRYVSAPIAFLSTFYFIAFPTFYTDMIFINRQEIAFLFLGLMLYMIFNDGLSLKKKQALFLIFGFGMVLSHYSTTYTVVAILIFLIIAQIILRWLMQHGKKMKLFSRSAVAGLNEGTATQKELISVGMVLVLIGATFLWSSVLTNTASGSLYRVISETISVVESNTKEDAKSGDVSYSLLSWQPIDLSKSFQDYQQSTVDVARAEDSTNIYYDSSLYQQYSFVAGPGDLIPLTPLGKAVASVGINVVSLNYTVRQGSAKLLQILILIGFLYILFRNRFFKKYLQDEYILFAIGSLIFIAAQVILPVLSLEYGVLRAFQQSLMFFGLFIVIGSLVIALPFGKKASICVAAVIAIGFFFSSSGVFTQIFGGYDPQLSANNTGLYYDIYYSHGSDIAGISWFSNLIKENTSQSWPEVQADLSLSPRLANIDKINVSSDIFPGLIRKDSYVLLDFTNVHNQQTTIFYQGNYITYAYPIEFLQANKDLIYNNGSFQIYR